EDVRVVEGDVLDVPLREEVAEAHPAGTPLSTLAECEVGLLELLEQGPDARAVVPEDDRSPLEALEVLERAPVPRLVGLVEGDEDRVEVGRPGDLVADLQEGGTLAKSLMPHSMARTTAAFAESVFSYRVLSDLYRHAALSAVPRVR
ncbi:MAG: hypothetical protein HY900_30585, partial [Deltaproteobacteria bacterium]|nr:hypothetical protein [Deltaproteobacteria bacterium]